MHTRLSHLPLLYEFVHQDICKSLSGNFHSWEKCSDLKRNKLLLVSHLEFFLTLKRQDLYDSKRIQLVNKMQIYKNSSSTTNIQEIWQQQKQPYTNKPEVKITKNVNKFRFKIATENILQQKKEILFWTQNRYWIHWYHQ